ncbi:MAG: deoxyribose-phosphate aldolase [Lachnospiraceae bacterium]|nr:deoxyribose-phosphate aldolase [Lachnospiraceae bacterium]
MTNEEILAKVDHTLLSTTATWEQIKEIVDDGIRFHTASVCIPAYYVAKASEYAKGRVPICTVIGFPNGYSTKETKCYEAANAVENGADEVDMVINVGALKDRKYDEIEEEIRDVKAACGEKILKVIIECCLLTDEEKVKMCEIVTNAGADYIKTSTGFSKSGATRRDVALMKAHVGENVKVKAAGGISTLENAREFLELGADRLGTSRIVKILKESK